MENKYEEQEIKAILADVRKTIEDEMIRLDDGKQYTNKELESGRLLTECLVKDLHNTRDCVNELVEKIDEIEMERAGKHDEE